MRDRQKPEGISSVEQQHSQQTAEYIGRLRDLNFRTLYGHGLREPVGGFPWEESAALIDQHRENGLDISALKDQLEARTPYNWRYTMQIAADTPLPREMDFSGEVGRVQFQLIDAVDQLPGLAKEENIKEVLGLVNYGINPDQEEGALLSKIIYDYSNPQARKVRSFRLDTVGGLAITEAQIAMGGWAASARIPILPNHIGANHESVYSLASIMSEATGKSNPSVAMFVDQGVMKYWPEFCDFAVEANQVRPDMPIYPVGNGGLVHKNGNLHYSNSHIEGQAPIPIDAVYTLADARRLLKEDCLDLLKAASEGKVYVEPTLNPLLNNYHLVRALLFHDSELSRSVIQKAFERTGSTNPLGDIETAKGMTIPMYLVDRQNKAQIEVAAGETREFTWDELIDDLKSTDGRKKILGGAVRERYILRSLLTHDLKSLSGGFGSVKLSGLKTRQLITILEESTQGMEEIRATGTTTKTIVGVEPLIFHPPKRMTIYDVDGEGEATAEELSVVHRFCPFYSRTSEGIRLISAVSFYSSTQDATYKLGGRIYAEGAHFR